MGSRLRAAGFALSRGSLALAPTAIWAPHLRAAPSRVQAPDSAHNFCSWLRLLVSSSAPNFWEPALGSGLQNDGLPTLDFQLVPKTESQLTIPKFWAPSSFSPSFGNLTRFWAASSYFFLAFFASALLPSQKVFERYPLRHPFLQIYLI